MRAVRRFAPVTGPPENRILCILPRELLTEADQITAPADSRFPPMHRLLRTAGPQTIAIMAFLLVTFLVLGMNDFNVGTDAGLHYGFANEVARFGWPLPATSYLSIMAHYPPVSHILALAIGALAGSTLRGIFAVAALSFVATYLALAELMRRPTVVGTVTTISAFLLIAYCLRKWNFLEGNELIANFFFAHFAATAVLLVSAILLFRSKLAFGRWLIAAAVTTHILAWIYTPCAIEFALACAAFRALAFLDVPSPRSAAMVAIAGLTLCAAAVVHPTMMGSLAIAGNDGGISIKAENEMGLFVGLMLGTLILIITRRQNDLVNQSAVIALSVGVAAACAAQYVALKFSEWLALCSQRVWVFAWNAPVLIWACLMTDVVRRSFPHTARPVPSTRGPPDRRLNLRHRRAVVVDRRSGKSPCQPGGAVRN